MMKYSDVDVSEAQLESLVQLHPEFLEPGLTYVDHQKVAAGGRLDVLLVDSGKSLVVAELKIVQDDGMLMQALDYYDDVTAHVEALARIYKDRAIDPTRPIRLVLVAPSFSARLVSRCKWIDAPISLFTFRCLKFEESEDIVPVFTEQALPTQPPVLTTTSLDDHFNYITDPTVRAEARALVLDEIKSWKPGNVTLDPIKGSISIKNNNRLIAYVVPRRKHYIVETYSPDAVWTAYPVKTPDDLATVKPLVRAAMEKFSS